MYLQDEKIQAFYDLSMLHYLSTVIAKVCSLSESGDSVYSYDMKQQCSHFGRLMAQNLLSKGVVRQMISVSRQGLETVILSQA